MASTAEMGCFTLTWEIKNVSVLLRTEAWTTLESTAFRMITSEGSVWKVIFLINLSDYVRLKHREKIGNSKSDRFEVSYISSRGEIRVPGTPYHDISRNALLGSSNQPLLSDDTLIVCCRMWKKAMQAEDIRIRTVLHRDNFFWNIENFNPYSSINYTYIERNSLLFYMSLEKNGDTHTFQVEVLPNISGSLTFLYFNPSINVLHGQITGKSSYSISTKRWEIEIFARNNTDRNFQLELEAIYAVHKELHGLPTSPECVQKVSEAVIRPLGTLNGDLLHLYREALHSDATLNTEGKSFPVHKNILSTRSEVFRAMFEKDQMKEGREGIVDIDDLDSETVDRMLVFLYGDDLEDINWEEASALYYAADKYAVCPLKQKCANILKAGLTVDNACDLLVVADKHSDQDLMKCAVDFILDHKEVISSPEWETLEESNYRLTSKIMKEIILKK